MVIAQLTGANQRLRASLQQVTDESLSAPRNADLLSALKRAEAAAAAAATELKNERAQRMAAAQAAAAKEDLAVQVWSTQSALPRVRPNRLVFASDSSRQRWKNKARSSAVSTKSWRSCGAARWARPPTSRAPHLVRNGRSPARADGVALSARTCHALFGGGRAGPRAGCSAGRGAGGDNARGRAGTRSAGRARVPEQHRGAADRGPQLDGRARWRSCRARCSGLSELARLRRQRPSCAHGERVGGGEGAVRAGDAWPVLSCACRPARSWNSRNTSSPPCGRSRRCSWRSSRLPVPPRRTWSDK